jgi:hypothetical protein
MAPLLSLRRMPPFCSATLQGRAHEAKASHYISEQLCHCEESRHLTDDEAISCYNGAMTDEGAGNNKKGNSGHQPCNPLWSIDKVSVVI